MTDIPRPRIIVLFAGAGGSTLGIHAALAAADVVGIDLDPAACATHRAAGNETVQADIATLSPRLYGPAAGLWASPPCPAFSTAGQGAGTKELGTLLAYLRDWAPGQTWRGDPAVWLVTEPLRWALTLMPEWVVLEQVPPVLPLWAATAQRLREVGYSTWTGILNAADYGVPQTRERAILLASRACTAHPPMATHAKHPHPRLDGTEELPWVSMADALGWGLTERPAFTVCAKDSTPVAMRNGARAQSTVRLIDEPAPTILASADNGGTKWVYDRPATTVMGTGHASNRAIKGERSILMTNRGQDDHGNRQEVTTDRPAPSVTAKAGSQWVWERPSTTVMGTPRIFPADGHHPEMGMGHASNRAIKVTLEELATLQDFPAGYPFQGNKTAVARQIGNAVPPRLAEVCVRAVCSTASIGAPLSTGAVPA